MSVQISTLDNGLRIATDSVVTAESVVVGAWVGVGTRHEPWRANGIAHLVEHMMFKGTRTRSAYALSAAIENKGGSMNAHTSREETAFYARVLPEEADNATDIVADMMRHSVFDPRELDREKQVIIQEIGRDLDSPEDYTYELMHKLAMPEQKIGRSILGSVDVIARMPRDAVADYVANYYTANNMVLVATGRIAHDDFVQMVKKRFARFPRGRKPVEDKARIVGGAKLVAKDIEQVHVILGFAGPGYRNIPAIYSTQVLSLILGGSASSRLFQKLREKRGLAYTVHSSHSSFSDRGIFQIYAGTDPQRVGEMIPVICDELKDVQHSVTRAELARAKAQLRAEILMGNESVMRRAEIIGHHVLSYGYVIPTDEIIGRLMAVEIDDVQAAAKRIFRRPPILTALGPLDNLESYKSIRARLVS